MVRAIIRDAAQEYYAIGWSVVPLVAGTKKPPSGFPLRRYLDGAERASKRRLHEWFAGDGRNIGIVCGPASDGLCVRDYDDAEAYRRWAAEHPVLAETLPTVKTARGAHVYLSTDMQDVRDASPSGSTIITSEDGELRAGGYVVAPPSVHPSGAEYHWLREPADGVPFVGDLPATGLLPAIRDQYTQGVSCVYCVSSHEASLAGSPADILEAIISASVPTAVGQRSRCLWELARRVKGIPALSNADQDTRLSIVREWWKRSRNIVGTTDFLESWERFENAWAEIRFPKWATLRNITADASGVGIERLADICRLLQQHEGDRPFFLDCRSAGVLVGVSYSQAAKWFRELRDSGRLELVRKGTRRRASEYRCIDNGS